MKAKKLTVKNLRLISDAELEFNKPLILLYGDIMQGKTTFLDAIKILFTAGFPDDLIQHGKKGAYIQLELENGSISRSFYINKKGVINARPLKAIVDNRELSARELQQLFNPFQLNQDFLKEMSPSIRKKFFVELFDIDTSEIDEILKKEEKRASDLRIEIKAFGEIDCTSVEKPDISSLEKEKALENTKLVKEFNETQNKTTIFNNVQSNRKNAIEIANKLHADIVNLVAPSIFTDCFDSELATQIRNELPKPERIKILNEEQMPDKTHYNEIIERISDSKADMLRWENYQQALARQKQKDAKRSALKECEELIRSQRQQKILKLSEYGKEISGLVFNETGELVFEGTMNDNLSTSQVIRLGSLLSKLYPDSLLDLELLDRGESLGTSIMTFVDKAKLEDKTILATIVGEKPAAVPEDVGVFVVENGKLIE